VTRRTLVEFAAGTVLVGSAFLAALVGVDLAVRGALQLGPLALVLAAAVVLVALRARRTVGNATSRMVSVRGHAHPRLHSGGRRHRASRHEAGHAVAAQRWGRLLDARVFADGSGEVGARLPNARAHLAFLWAGQVAHGSGEGAGFDNAEIRRVLRGFPASQRDAVSEQTRADAARLVASQAGQIRRISAVLDRQGEYS
jgi:hypothetical protein